MADPLLQHLEALCQEGDAIDLAEYRGPERAVGWSKKVAAFFRASGGISEAADFEKISGRNTALASVTCKGSWLKRGQNKRL